MSISTSFMAVFCLFLALASQLVSAQAANSTNTKLTTKTTISCYTIMAETPVAVVANTTSTMYTNKTFNIQHTSTPSIITIPPTFTRTDTQTKHTVVTTTLGFDNTSTSTKTYTRTSYSIIPGITNTTTVTASVTTTLSTLTSILKTTSGFRDIRDTRETYSPKLSASAPYMNATLSRRDDDDDDDNDTDVVPDTTNSTSVVPTIGLSRLNALVYPSLVSCIATVVTSTGYTTVLPANTTTTRIGHTPTTVAQFTTTLTATHTKILNNASHTRTTSSMFIFTTGVTAAHPITSTIYTTTTFTLPTTTTTYYGACRTQRVLGPILPSGFPKTERGLTVDDIYYDQDVLQLWSFYTPTNYTCCQACQDQPDCAFGAWDSISEFCYMQRRKDGLALGQNETSGVYVSANRNTTSVPFAFMAYNGPAGYLSDGGVDKD